MKPSIFCISTYEKGQRFLTEAAAEGCEVRLLTVDKLRDADWPKDILTEFLTMPENLTPGQMLNTVSYLARTRRIDRIVPLDEFDLEAAALLREHMRLLGLGETATRFFRDKLAMRTEARAGGIAVPEFSPVFQYDDLRGYMRDVPGPWLLKPRTNASAIGIKPINHPERALAHPRPTRRPAEPLRARAFRRGRGLPRGGRDLAGRAAVLAALRLRTAADRNDAPWRDFLHAHAAC